jgi:hypothetical protein
MHQPVAMPWVLCTNGVHATGAAAVCALRYQAGTHLSYNKRKHHTKNLSSRDTHVENTEAGMTWHGS